MTIQEAFHKKGNYDLRLTNYYRWMVWNEFDNLWVVYEQRRYQKKVKVIIKTEYEHLAIEKLLEE